MMKSVRWEIALLLMFEVTFVFSDSYCNTRSDFTRASDDILDIQVPQLCLMNSSINVTFILTKENNIDLLNLEYSCYNETNGLISGFPKDFHVLSESFNGKSVVDIPQGSSYCEFTGCVKIFDIVHDIPSPSSIAKAKCYCDYIYSTSALITSSQFSITTHELSTISTFIATVHPSTISTPTISASTTTALYTSAHESTVETPSVTSLPILYVSILVPIVILLATVCTITLGTIFCIIQHNHIKAQTMDHRQIDYKFDFDVIHNSLPADSISLTGSVITVLATDTRHSSQFLFDNTNISNEKFDKNKPLPIVGMQIAPSVCEVSQYKGTNSVSSTQSQATDNTSYVLTKTLSEYEISLPQNNMMNSHVTNKLTINTMTDYIEY